MIGPVGTAVAGASGVGKADTIKLKPSGVEVVTLAPAKPSVAAELAALGAPINASRVAELRGAITEGRYQVDSQAIAGAMIASER